MTVTDHVTDQTAHEIAANLRDALADPAVNLWLSTRSDLTEDVGMLVDYVLARLAATPGALP